MFSRQGWWSVSVFTIVGIIIGWRVINPVVYWMNPLLAACAMACIAISLPYPEQCQVLIETVLGEWKKFLLRFHRIQMVVAKRIIGSLQQFVFRVKNSRGLDRARKVKTRISLVTCLEDLVLLLRKLFQKNCKFLPVRYVAPVLHQLQPLQLPNI